MNDPQPTPRPWRFAIYFSPPPGSPWSVAGARWLGRGIDGERAVRQAVPAGWDAAGFAALTAEPRRYGWHATLRAPFRLADGVDAPALHAALGELVADCAAFDLPPLEPATMGGFLALRPVVDSAPLQSLARRCVTELQRLAAPPTDAEIAQRRRAGLTPEQDAMLLRWGYPYVLDGFRFHLTLTGRLAALPPPRVAALQQRAREIFTALPQPVRVDALSLFVESHPGAEFVRIARFALAS